MPSVDRTITAWQTERREIGMLEFAATVIGSERFPYWELPDSSTFLGMLESDALCLLADGTLCVYDHEVADRLLCAAAPDQSSLISALSEMEAYLERCVDDDDLADDESAHTQMREKCTELIGGTDYAAFVQLFFWAQRIGSSRSFCREPRNIGFTVSFTLLNGHERLYSQPVALKKRKPHQL